MDIRKKSKYKQSLEQRISRLSVSQNDLQSIRQELNQNDSQPILEESIDEESSQQQKKKCDEYLLIIDQLKSEKAAIESDRKSLMNWNEQLQQKLEFIQTNPGAAKFVTFLKQSLKKSKASKAIKRKSIVNDLTAIQNEFQSKLTLKDQEVSNLKQKLNGLMKCDMSVLQKENDDLKAQVNALQNGESFKEREELKQNKAMQEWIVEMKEIKAVNASQSEDVKNKLNAINADLKQENQEYITEIEGLKRVIDEWKEKENVVKNRQRRISELNASLRNAMIGLRKLNDAQIEV